MLTKFDELVWNVTRVHLCHIWRRDSEARGFYTGNVRVTWWVTPVEHDLVTWRVRGSEARGFYAGNVRVTGSVTTVEQDLATCRVQGSEARGFYRGNVRVTGSVIPVEQDLVTLQGARFWSTWILYRQCESNRMSDNGRAGPGYLQGTRFWNHVDSIQAMWE
jgi:hypothetical protein